MNYLTEKDLKIPEGKQLYHFQRKAILKAMTYIRNIESRAIYNACEMGLGKTIQTCVTLNSLFVKRGLIICPAVMRYTWEDELREWIDPNLNIKVITKSKDLTRLNNFLDIDYIVCSYDIAAKDATRDILASFKYDALILDEAHYLKSLKTKRTKSVLRYIWDKAYYKIALSGTPFTNNVVDCFPLFNKIMPEAFPTFEQFVDRYSYSRQLKLTHMRKPITQYHGLKNPGHLRDIIRGNFFIRYLKKDVLSELPPKTYKNIKLDKSYAVGLEDELALKSKAEVESLKQIIESGGAIPQLSALATHRRLQGRKKFKPVVQYVDNLLDEGIPVVLFAYHREVLNEYKTIFEKYQPSYIDGDVPSEARHEAVKRFQEGHTNLFIGQMVAAGVGITLTRSSTVVLAELDFSPAIVNQAIDRVHRISQKNLVNVVYFTVKDSIDEAINQIVLSKAKNFNALFN